MKNIHFVFGLHDDGFKLCDRVAIRSAHVHNPDWRIYLWCPEEPAGEQWEKLKANTPIQIMRIQNPHTWNGKTIPQHQHRADLIRHTVLYAMGGLYCDTDTITLRSYPEEWLEHDSVIGRETSGDFVGLCNAIMYSRMHGQFQWKWLEKWQEFDGSGWNEISVRYPWELHKENPGLCKVVDFEMLGFMYGDLDKYWEGIHSLKGCVIAHIWRTYSREKMAALTEEIVRQRDNTYCFHAAGYL